MITEAMKQFFGQGEQDVDLMLRYNLVSEDLILYFWKHDPSSPGFNGIALPGFESQNAETS